MSGSPVGVGFLYERTDIHKSCKSLEVLLNILNDYCEAAGAVVMLQKRLVKALKETASLKATSEIPSNALAACAVIFETLSEVDNKFAKLADKEYESAASDVKKWFKKLAKEEKTHDERVDGANARIKQAAQFYDRKSKRNPRESVEEHSRYINLISTLGPELSQEKYNHTLNVTQRHTTTTYAVAACISRIADAEWQRTCENIRRVSPTVGQLGEWKALCEGGWVGAVPHDLPEFSKMEAPRRHHQAPPPTLHDSEESPEANLHHEARQSLEEHGSRQDLHFNTPPTSTAPTSYTPPKPAFLDDNTGSLRSLSAFPAPPTHIPPSPTFTRPQHSSQMFTASPEEGTSTKHINETRGDSARSSEAQRSGSHSDVSFPRTSSPVSSKGISSATSTGINTGNDERDGEERRVILKDRLKGQEHERGLSSESRVAAIRSRFSESEAVPRPTSPGPKDIPRLPLSVSGLASRYNTGDGPASPPLRTTSPPTARRQTLPPLDTLTETARLAETMFGQRTIEKSNSSEKPTTTDPKKTAGGDVNELEAREKKLRDMERDIRQREAELEHKEQRQRRLSSQHQSVRPASAVHHNNNHSPRLPPRHSPSMSHLGAPMSPSQSRDSATSRTSLHLSVNSSKPDASSEHASFCGCDTCSVSKYRTTSAAPSPHDLRPPDKPFALRPEKPKGWIRRLSMPVGHALSLDSSRKSPGAGSFAISKSGGIGFSLDSRKNASATQLPYIKEDGQLSSLGGRRSYDAHGLGSKNSSLTNLAAMTRRS